MGRLQLARATNKSSNAPEKYFTSVEIETEDIPASSYALITSKQFKSECTNEFRKRRLCWAMIPIAPLFKLCDNEDVLRSKKHFSQVEK